MSKRCPKSKLLLRTRRRSTANPVFAPAAIVWLVIAYVDGTTTKEVDASVVTKLVGPSNTHSFKKREVLLSSVPSVICSNNCSCFAPNNSNSATELNTADFSQPHDSNSSLKSTNYSSATTGGRRVPSSHRRNNLRRRRGSSDDEARGEVRKLNEMVRVASGTTVANGSVRGNELSSGKMLTPLHFVYRQNVEYRIVGGVPAKIEDFPFVASLQTSGQHICGSSIVSQYWLLSAAHCFLDPTFHTLNEDPAGYSIMFGSAALSGSDTEPCFRNMKRRKPDLIKINPAFEESTLWADLSMIRVTDAMSFRKEIKPAVLPKMEMTVEGELHAGVHCDVAGWGATEPRTSLQPRMSPNEWMSCYVGKSLTLLPLLQKVQLSLISIEKCLHLYKLGEGVMSSESSLCTLSSEEKDACNGDSGGPLICLGTLVGVVSWGRGCARKANPGVYARVDTHLEWINENLRNIAPNSVNGLAGITTAVFCLLLAVAADPMII